MMIFTYDGAANTLSAFMYDNGSPHSILFYVAFATNTGVISEYLKVYANYVMEVSCANLNRCYVGGKFNYDNTNYAPGVLSFTHSTFTALWMKYFIDNGAEETYVQHVHTEVVSGNTD